jgi:transposase
LSLGWVTVLWLTGILSEGDHRLARVEPWGRAHQRTRSRLIGRQVKPRDLNDDRLATVLDYLSVEQRWGACERERNQRVMRVDDLQARVARIDTTTAAAGVTPEGLFPLGHSKDHRPDLPQVKSAMSTLDPLGLPLTPTVVAGHTADDPLSLPEIAKVRQIAQATGLTDVGDCTMAALGTRAELVAHQASSLCPLSAKQRPEAELDRLLASVFSGEVTPLDIRLPNADGQIDKTDDPVAVGFAYTLEQSGQDQAKQRQHWLERRLVVRSLAFAASQEKRVLQRVERAVTAINALDPRTQGKKRLPDAAAAQQATAALLATHRVVGLVDVSVWTDTHEHVKRRDGPRPPITVYGERVRVRAERDDLAVAHAVRRRGWRVSTTNHTTAELSLAQGVAAYRSEYLIEQGFGRLKGRPWSLTPWFLPYAHRVAGLLDLLSIALRVLVLMQCVVRRNLQQQGATLKGISPGQPGRQTTKPPTAMMLQAFRGLTLSQITVEGQMDDHLTPLNEVQQRILALMEVSREIYYGLVTQFSNTAFHLPET